ncbi:uncharacterized protein LOC132203820 [Neocloeon triangulifer]|uniref:uncharacterized protein LOC132203820 n=1 Tax=Neocloeon triangulifer TaxID=2078957 RepID=UPI00286F5F62|nr:uncharacterized protein LOC132203820 [Neocloeon triangulifer]
MASPRSPRIDHMTGLEFKALEKLGKEKTLVHLVEQASGPNVDQSDLFLKALGSKRVKHGDIPAKTLVKTYVIWIEQDARFATLRHEQNFVPRPVQQAVTEPDRCQEKVTPTKPLRRSPRLNKQEPGQVTAPASVAQPAPKVRPAASASLFPPTQSSALNSGINPEPAEDSNTSVYYDANSTLV